MKWAGEVKGGRARPGAAWRRGTAQGAAWRGMAQGAGRCLYGVCTVFVPVGAGVGREANTLNELSINVGVIDRVDLRSVCVSACASAFYFYLIIKIF